MVRLVRDGGGEGARWREPGTEVGFARFKSFGREKSEHGEVKEGVPDLPELAGPGKYVS